MAIPAMMTMQYKAWSVRYAENVPEKDLKEHNLLQMKELWKIFMTK